MPSNSSTWCVHVASQAEAFLTDTLLYLLNARSRTTRPCTRYILPSRRRSPSLTSFCVAHHSQAEFFKTLLHPSSMASPTLAGDNASIYSLDSNEDDTRLPPGVSLDQVYSDLIAYLVTQSRHWFESTTLQYVFELPKSINPSA